MIRVRCTNCRSVYLGTGFELNDDWKCRYYRCNGSTTATVEKTYDDPYFEGPSGVIAQHKAKMSRLAGLQE